MCGIFALLDPGRVCELDVNIVYNALEHRGPDDRGWLTWNGERVERGREPKTTTALATLIHRRLSIIDLSPGGWQPFSTPDGDLHITFNGEIYNYLELREELKSLGEVFYTDSDTEVLIKCWRLFGSDCLNRLRGMFAFAIIDLDRSRFWIARDNFGVKPLYIRRGDGWIAFSSEIAPLLRATPGKSTLNVQAIYDFIEHGITDSEGRTLFDDICIVAPGSVMEFDLRNAALLKTKVFWTPQSRIVPGISVEQGARGLRDAFFQSISRQLRSDVPVGACLSGGVDSSAIVCAMRALNPKAELHAFTFVSSIEEKNEEHWAAIVSEHAGAVQHKVRIRPDEFVEGIEDVVRRQSQPFGSTRIFAQYKLFERAKEVGLKVVLDGQGADELLAGYTSYIGIRLIELTSHRDFRQLRDFAFAKEGADLSWSSLISGMVYPVTPPKMRSLTRVFLGLRPSANILCEDWFRERGVRQSSMPKIPLDLKKALAFSMTVGGLQHLLRYEDRNSMAFSIEARVPFMDVDLADFALSLPVDQLISPARVTKAAFRGAMRGIVPDAILDRRDKIGFGTEENEWLGAYVQARGREIFKDDGLPPFLKGTALRHWFSRHHNRLGDSPFAWRLINIILFYREHTSDISGFTTREKSKSLY